MSRRARRGIMLLEAAIALLVIGMVAAAALDLFATQLRAFQQQPARLTAVALAQDRVAAIRLALTPQTRALPDSLARGTFGAPFTAFAWRATLTRSGTRNLHDLRVDVTWTSGAYTLATRILRPPVATRAEVRR